MGAQRDTRNYPAGMLTTTQRRTRALASGLVAFALLVGTFWGDDDHFPFGPFRMYSTTSDPNGEITVPFFRAVDASGRSLELRSRDFGLRPAEVNGQIYSVRDDPAYLEHFAAAYERLHPSEPHLVELTLWQGLHILEDSRPVAYRERQLARWEETA